MKKIAVFFTLLFFVSGAFAAPTATTNTSYYFLITPQTDTPPIWRPIANKNFPILNRSFLQQLSDSFSFIENIAVYQPERIEVGNNQQDKRQVIHYCFDQGNFLTASIEQTLAEGVNAPLFMSEPLLNSLAVTASNLSVTNLPVTVTKFIEVYALAVPQGVSAPPDYTTEQLTVHGVLPAALKLGKSNEFVFSNGCVLPEDEAQAQAARFDKSYVMPHTILLKSTTADSGQLHEVMQLLKEFFADSRPSLYFQVEQVFQ